jgi:hypothetical protein
VWVAGPSGPVVRIDPRTNRIVARVTVPYASWTAASADAVWTASSVGTLTRIDPKTNRAVAHVDAAFSNLGDPAVVAGKVWFR